MAITTALGLIIVRIIVIGPGVRGHHIGIIPIIIALAVIIAIGIACAVIGIGVFWAANPVLFANIITGAPAIE